ncbi:organic solute transporter subunit alpha-like [Chaetodon trifascialis]|uniref:organic solute transporter subunit alpha-like n=1 Tax=Chaetodon trifascialis TaxID=109706 RepID=UPI0039958077
MEEDLNSTIHPACLEDPPLAIDVISQLDVYDICLYSMLTFMSCMSLLLYLEQCVYIYKNLGYPKKTSLIWISGAAPVIATMSCLGMWIPKAVMFTDMTSNCFFAVVVYKILVLMIKEFGGSTDFLRRFSGKPFKISTGPCCCCCYACLPYVPMSWRMLFLMKLAALQYAILKTAFSVFSIVLWTNGEFNPSNLGVTSVGLWINLFVGVLTIISLWPVAILFMNTKNYLRSINMIPKYAMYQLVLVLSQLQTSIINILAMNGVIACAPPFSSKARGSMLSQQMMIMEMFIITLVNRFFYHRTYNPIPCEEHDNDQNVKLDVHAALEEHDV